MFMSYIFMSYFLCFFIIKMGNLKIIYNFVFVKIGLIDSEKKLEEKDVVYVCEKSILILLI